MANPTFQVTGNGTPGLAFSISVVGSAVSVQVATDGLGNALTTVGELYAALIANAQVAALMTPSSEGTPAQPFNENIAVTSILPNGTPIILFGEFLAFVLSSFSSGTLTLTFKGMKVYGI